MLELRNISKTFPGINALSNVTLTVRKASVHVVCGENGAGKSTIMKILSGVYRPDSGNIFLHGKEIFIRTPIDAEKYRISMIFQELNYIPEITIAEFLYLGHWPTTFLKTIDWKAIQENAKQILKNEHIPFSFDTKLKDISISTIQLLEIIKATVIGNSDIIIMDEPTSAITNNEVELLFKKIDTLTSQGKSIIYVSHKMEEIFQIADDISILRDGFLVSSGNKASFTMDSVITHMVGREISREYPKKEVLQGDMLLEVKDISNEAFHSVSFSLREGEIIGFAGLIGAGRTEVARALFGLDAYAHGAVYVRNQPVSIRNPIDAIERGIVMLSEDRRRFGLIPIRSVKENITLSSLQQYIHHGRLHKKAEEKDVNNLCEKMNIKTSSIDVNVDVLSGGNQQKVVFAKWLLQDPSIFIMDEPTRGIDVGAKYEMYTLMQELVQQKKGILMISSELPELMGMCDRIYILHEGTITGQIQKHDFNSETIMKYATGLERTAVEEYV